MTLPHDAAPQYVLWEITLACNLRCRHCLTSSGQADAGELSTSEALATCDGLAELGVRAVALMGGEPLMRPDWHEIASQLSGHAISTSLVTNGLRFDEATARQARDVGVSQVVVSVDGDRASHDAIRGRGSFDAALRALRVARQAAFPNRMVVTSVHRDNLDALPALLSTLVDVAPGAVWAINQTSIRPGQRLPAERRIDADGFLRVAAFIAQARRSCAEVLDVVGAHDVGYHSVTYPDVQGAPWAGCRAGLSTMGITARGLVKGCLALPDECVEADVRIDGVASIWRRAGGFAYNRGFELARLGPRCAGCAHGATCRGGCTEFGLTMNDHPHQAPFCLHRWEREGVP